MGRDWKDREEKEIGIKRERKVREEKRTKKWDEEKKTRGEKSDERYHECLETRYHTLYVNPEPTMNKENKPDNVKRKLARHFLEAFISFSPSHSPNY